MGKNRPACNKVSYVLILRLDLVFLLIFFIASGFCTPYEDIQPVPSVHVQLVNVFLDFGGLKGEPFGKHKAHSPSDAVCPYSLKISVPFNLSFFGWVSVNTDRAILDYQADLVFRRHVLQACDSLVKNDLFYITLYFLRPWLVAVNSYPTPYVITNEHGKGLGCPACTPDRPGIKNPDILGTIVILSQFYLINPFNRGCNHSFCDDSHGNPDRSFNCILFCCKVPHFSFCYLTPDFESRFFP